MCRCCTTTLGRRLSLSRTELARQGKGTNAFETAEVHFELSAFARNQLKLIICMCMIVYMILLFRFDSVRFGSVSSSGHHLLFLAPLSFSQSVFKYE